MSVYQVVADGLPADFPMLRSVDDFAGNLPQQLSSLVGRDAVVEEVAELVRSHRLVTLSGVGGVGKTRLALEVGIRVGGRVPRRRVDGRAGLGRRPGLGPRGRSRRCWASRRRATRR